MTKQGVAGRGVPPCGSSTVPSPFQRWCRTVAESGAHGVLDGKDVMCLAMGGVHSCVWERRLSSHRWVLTREAKHPGWVVGRYPCLSPGPFPT